MKQKHNFSEADVIHRLKHYLPCQAPLKDFIHHNTLHAFQHLPFHKGLQQASETFGYQVYLSLDEYRALYMNNQIGHERLRKVLLDAKGEAALTEWMNRLTAKHYNSCLNRQVGQLREQWKAALKINFDKEIFPMLFRLAGNYLDQGIASKKFPYPNVDFLSAIRLIQNNSYVKIFNTPQVQEMFNNLNDHTFSIALKRLAGKEEYFEQYLFDQQFAHPGWSGMVSFVEDYPESLLDSRTIHLKDFILLEMLLELDLLYDRAGDNWLPLAEIVDAETRHLSFGDPAYSEIYEVYALWQEAYEWSYYDTVLADIQKAFATQTTAAEPSFQAIFCIDDREESLRRHLEKQDSACETFSTAGFFNIPFYYQPAEGKFYTKSCPAPLTPQHLVKEEDASKRHRHDVHFTTPGSGFLSGWLVPGMGFWSAIKMVKSIFYPTETEAVISSFQHMDPKGRLLYKNNGDAIENGLKQGFTIAEMVEKTELLLKGMGLVKEFAPIVYLVGHGASSANNTYYAGYDCGACSGRAGSVNARVAAAMLNEPEVRRLLGSEKGINIPNSTRFIGALHDTTRDEIEFYDTAKLDGDHREAHQRNVTCFHAALESNAQERSHNFFHILSTNNPTRIHNEVKKRSLSLFEPRPEWNHATNCLCIIGSRALTKSLFLNRRAFLNSYDHRIDADGKLLLAIFNAIAPVCGGINLEYYFSRVDTHNLGSGSKLPHNVIGLFGVANGMEGDLRTGLPEQMVSIHDPLRLLVAVVQYPEKALQVIQTNPATYEWFKNNWIHLVAVHPDDGTLYRFMGDRFETYETAQAKKELQSLELMI